MSGDVPMQDAAPIVPDQEEHIEGLKVNVCTARKSAAQIFDACSRRKVRQEGDGAGRPR